VEESVPVDTETVVAGGEQVRVECPSACDAVVDTEAYITRVSLIDFIPRCLCSRCVASLLHCRRRPLVFIDFRCYRPLSSPCGPTTWNQCSCSERRRRRRRHPYIMNDHGHATHPAAHAVICGGVVVVVCAATKPQTPAIGV